MQYLETYKINYLLNLILAVGFVSFLTVSSFTIHYHKTYDGRIISHSHISTDSEGSNNSYPEHTHKEIEFFFIYSNLNFNSIISESNNSEELRINTFQKVSLNSENFIESVLVESTSNKSPPAPL